MARKEASAPNRKRPATRKIGGFISSSRDKVRYVLQVSF